MPRPFLLALGRPFLGLALGLAAWAQGSGHRPVRTYGFQEGLKNLTVLALAQDAQGHLWAGTEAGLYRFDGRRFEALPFPDDASRYVTALLAEPGGRLWVGTRNGLGWLDPPNGAFHPQPDLPGGRIESLGLDARGGVWALVGNQVFLRGAADAPFHRLAGGPGAEPISGLFADPGHPEVLATTATELWTLKKGAWLREPGPRHLPHEAHMGVAVDGLGTIWLRTTETLYRRGPGEKGWTALPAVYGGALPDNFQMRRDREGWVWITTLKRLLRCRGAEVRPMDGGAKSYVPVTGMVDREGSPWIAAIGLTRILGRGLWELHTVDEGLPNNVVWHALRDPQDRLWLATDGGLVLGTPTGWRVVKAGQFSRLRLHPDGSLLAVGSPGAYLYRVDLRTLAVEGIRVDAMPLSAASRGLAVAEDGTVWVSDYRNGAAWGRREQGRWTWHRATLDGREIPEVLQVVQNSEGSIFLATRTAAYHLEGGAWVSLGTPAAHHPYAATLMPEGDVWVSYVDRPLLTRHRKGPGGWSQVEEWWPRPDRPDLVIYSHQATPEGRLWIGTSQGLGRLDPRGHAVEAWYPPGDGIPGADACNEALVRDGHGDLWYGTTEGLGRLRAAEEWPLPPLPAPTLLGVADAEERNGTFTLAPGRALELHVACNAFVAPEDTVLEVRSGPKGDWMRFEDTRLHLGVLPAGRHALEVRALRGGQGPGPSLAVAVEVLPFWWERLAVRLLGLAALAGLVALIVKLRSRALAQHNRDLQLQVEARTQELALANAGLQQASKAKSLFLASMSHELRTPLNAILLYSELLADTARERKDEEGIQDVKKIQAAGSHLLSMINGILDLSKIEAGMMELDLAEADMGSLLLEVADTLRPLAEQKGNRLVVEAPPELPPFRTDATKLRQVLINLAGNACKFTEKGRVTLSARADGEGLAIEVVDTGIGMSAEQLARIFNAFEQADEGIQKKFGGTGLGLTISQRLVQLLEGRIEVRSTPGAGSAFTLHLPRLASEGSGAHALLSADLGPGGATVLLIDDDAPTLEALSRSLTKLGFDVRTAASGPEGLERAQAIRPDIILLDIVMSGMDGWEVLSRLKADPVTAPIPVLLLTFSEDKARGLALGAMDLLKKPVPPEHLAAVLHRYGGRSLPLKVLVVEDDPLTREAIAGAVTRAGWTCQQAAGAEEALERLAEELPHIILLDLTLPVMDGFQFVELLQQHPEWREIPVVVVTARDLSSDDLQRLMVPQVQKVLRKGSQTREGLVALVQSLCQRHAPRPPRAQ